MLCRLLAGAPRMSKKHCSKFLLENLEPRLLFSADVALLPVDGGALSLADDSSLEVVLRPTGEGVNSDIQMRQ